MLTSLRVPKRRSPVSARKLGVALAISLLSVPIAAYASDHNESAEVQKDAFADLTDLYVFASENGHFSSAAPRDSKEISVIVNWAGFNFSRPQPDAEGAFSRDYLYALHIDNNGDGIDDHTVYWRFGQSSTGQWGVQVTGLPGSEGVISGPVEKELSGGNDTAAYAGHGAETFRLDVQGFLDTLATGTVSFNNQRSVLNGLNVTYMALRFPTAAVANGDHPLGFWITSARRD